MKKLCIRAIRMDTQMIAQMILSEMEDKIKELRKLTADLEKFTGKRIEEIEEDFAQSLQELEEYFGYLKRAILSKADVD